MQPKPELAAEYAEGCTGPGSRKAKGKAWLSCPLEEPGQGSRSRNNSTRGRVRDKAQQQELLPRDTASRQGQWRLLNPLLNEQDTHLVVGFSRPFQWKSCAVGL